MIKNTKNVKKVNSDNQIEQNYIMLNEIQKNIYRHKLDTRGFKAPEVIFHNSFQSVSIDLWIARFILLIILRKRLPIFNLSQFSKIYIDTMLY